MILATKAVDHSSEGKGESNEEEPSFLPIPVQSGSGSNPSNNDDLSQLGLGSSGSSGVLEHIAKLVVKSIIPAAINQFQNYNLGPPAQVSTSDPNTNPQLPFQILQTKDDLNNEFDEAHLLKALPPKFRRLGQILIKEFNRRANEVTWTSDGTLLIDEISIPRSNIFIIFPLLFKTHRLGKNVPGFPELLIKLNDMGLGHLIKSQPRQMKGKGSKKTFSNPSEPLPSSSKHTKWWYLG